jgi:uncharacterized protein YjbJ (UPF0337 family)
MCRTLAEYLNQHWRCDEQRPCRRKLETGEGQIKEQWGKLTDDEVDQLEGKGDQLAGKLQERYGIARDEAERQARDFRTSNNWN